MRTVTLIFIVFALLAKMAFSSDLSEPDIAVYEEVTYRTLLQKTGQVIWQSKLSIDKTTKDQEEIVKIREDGRGRYNNSPMDMGWVVETRFVSSPQPRVFETLRTAFSLDKKELWRKNKIFDHAKRNLIAEHFQGGKLIKRRALPQPEGVVVTSEILSLILRGYNFETQVPYDFYVFSSDAKLAKLQARKVNTETVRVPAGVFECYTLEVTLDLGLANYFSRHFFPKTYLWFTVKKPHFWVKYEGMESGISSPYVIMEITDYKRMN